MTRRKRSSSSSSTSAKSNKFDVFELNEDDERIEKDSARILRKFSNPSKKPHTTSPITKYRFLQHFAHGSKTPSKKVAVDPIVLCESDDEDKCPPEKPCDKPFEVDDNDDDHGGGGGGGGVRDDQLTCANSCSIDVNPQDSADRVIPAFADFVDCDIELKDQSLDKVSEDDDNSQITSSSTSTLNPSQAEVSLEDKLVGHGSTACDIDGIKKVVDVCPDFIRYEDLYSTCSQLIFSCSSLKLEGSRSNGTEGTFKIEWEIEDIIKIESWWLGKVETAMINILLKSKDSGEAGNTNTNRGFKLLKFGVYDPYWAKTEQSIKLLEMKYANLWSTILDIDTYNDENISMGLDSFFSQKHYFPTFDEAFDEVIFPKGEPDAVSISKRDVELLQPETFINDTIIDFYIKYLKNKIPPDEQGRFHFFNSFFFRKLADLDKDPSSACDGKAAFHRVRKWTRKVNLFEKDYIIIPVNYSLHWSLIVICHPGEVISFKDEDIEESSKVPCILHMDSLKGSHKGLKNVFQSYLGEEWKERHSNVEDEVFSKFLHMRFVSLELPQQENFYDCGLFLLHYVECFLIEAPINFNPFKITKFSDFLKSNWFPPQEASLKRSHIQNLIYDIFDDNSLQAPSADCLDKGPLSELPGIVEQKVEAGSLNRDCYPAKGHGRNPSSSCSEQETDIQFPAVSPVRVPSCLREPGLVSKDLQIAVNSYSRNCLQTSACSHGRFMSPIEETEESGEETASLEMEDSQAAILTSDLPSTSYISNDHRLSKTPLQGLCVNLLEAVGGHPYSRTSSAYFDTSGTEAHEDLPLKKTEMSDIPDKTDALENLSTSGEALADSIVQDSQEANDGNDVSESVKSHSLFRGVMNSVTHHQIFDLEQDTALGDDTLGSKKESLVSEPDKRDAKRPKLMNAGRSQTRRFTRSMSKKECLLSCE